MSTESADEGHAEGAGKPGAVHGYGRSPLLMLRATLGGALMGLANLVPGISGGTMLLASGIYPFVMRAIADVSALRFRKSTLSILAVTVASAIASIVIFAGLVHAAVVEQRYMTYSFFIGLTLGGLPVVWAMARPVNPAVFVGAALGFVPMAALAYAQLTAGDASAVREGFWLFVAAGALGGSAMILPGVSGAYVLMIFGAYVPVLAAVGSLKGALATGDFVAALEPGAAVILPVGLGVVLGVGVVSRAFAAALRRYEKLTMGVLLGFLGGAVLGLYPFQRGVRPFAGQLVRGRILSENDVLEMPAHKFPTEFFAPSTSELLIAAMLVFGGFAVTALVAKFGGDKQSGLSAVERDGEDSTDHPA